MNYITEINRFYDWLDTNQVPKAAISLWHALLHINNKTGWSQTFTVAIPVLELKTGFKKSEICEARNILQARGRIAWTQRGGSLCAEYEIISFCDAERSAAAILQHLHFSDSVRSTHAKPTQTATQSTTETGTQTGTHSGTISKLKETTLNETKHTLPPPVAPAIKKVEIKIEKTEHWPAMVDTWFTFYKKRYLIDPTFNGAAAKNLKLILQQLKKRSTGQEWTQEYAAAVFNRFLQLAFDDQWLNTNFLLSNLYSKFDTIISKKNGNTKTQKTGANVSASSILAKINSVPVEDGGY